MVLYLNPIGAKSTTLLSVAVFRGSVANAELSKLLFFIEKINNKNK